jgi:acyl-CoA synthetase (AMP-forming)/AMP-acid ligase II
LDTENTSEKKPVQEIVPIISGKVNIAEYLEKQVENQPCSRAVIVPSGRNNNRNLYSHVTYVQLLDLCDRYAWGLESSGIKFGDRVIIGIRPGIDLVAITFALFKLGAVPVFIDPGMGKKGLLSCIKQIEARAVIAEFKAHILAWLNNSAFKSVEIFINTGTTSFGRMKSLQALSSRREYYPICETESADVAAILFTSGSTGTAKGVIYTHSTFAHQIKLIRKAYSVTTEDVDMSIFPLFALFAVSLGMPTVIPDMDCSRPLTANPRKICRVIHDQGVTFSFGSPAFWDKMASFSIQHSVKFPSLKKLLMAGCSVPGELHQRFLDSLLGTDGDVYVPYGATEALPLTSFRGSEVLMMTREKSDAGCGTCVGRTITDKVEIRIIKIKDEPISDWDESLVLPNGEIGEIVVKGVIVTHEYFNRPDANEKSKIREGRYIWHRMGDVGYIDDEGLLWFCGRKVDRVSLSDSELYTDQCENIFNTHPKIRRSALVGFDGAEGVEPVVIVQPLDSSVMKDETVQKEIEKELLSLGGQYEQTRKVKRILFRKCFPVDVRHNAKIKREILTVWADSVLRN